MKVVWKNKSWIKDARQVKKSRRRYKEEKINKTKEKENMRNRKKILLNHEDLCWKICSEKTIDGKRVRQQIRKKVRQRRERDGKEKESSSRREVKEREEGRDEKMDRKMNRQKKLKPYQEKKEKENYLCVLKTLQSENKIDLVQNRHKKIDRQTNIDR